MQQRKAVYFLVFASFVFSVVVFALVGEQLGGPAARAQGAQSGTVALLNVLAMASLLTSSVLALLLLRPRGVVGAPIEPLSPERLQVNTLICLAFGELCTLFGFFMKSAGAVASLVPYAAGTLIVYFLTILPFGIAQWNLIDRGANPG